MNPETKYTYEVPNSIINFAEVAYKQFDSSHDISHAHAVTANALTVCNQITELQPWLHTIIAIAMLHDARDGKYVVLNVCISEQDLYSFFEKETGNGLRCMWVVNNISWSKRSKYVSIADVDPSISEEDIATWNVIRYIVQAADWIEALGYIGIQRATEYTIAVHKNTGSSVTDHVCQHIKEKLLHIPDELANRAVGDKRIYQLIALLCEVRTIPLRDYLAKYQ